MTKSLQIIMIITLSINYKKSTVNMLLHLIITLLSNETTNLELKIGAPTSLHMQPFRTTL